MSISFMDAARPMEMFGINRPGPKNFEYFLLVEHFVENLIRRQFIFKPGWKKKCTSIQKKIDQVQSHRQKNGL